MAKTKTKVSVQTARPTKDGTIVYTALGIAADGHIRAYKTRIGRAWRILTAIEAALDPTSPSYAELLFVGKKELASAQAALNKEEDTKPIEALFQRLATAMSKRRLMALQAVRVRD